MLKTQEENVSVLGVCINQPLLVGRVEGLTFHSAHSARRAIDMLRILSYDLVVVGMQLPDRSLWDFLRHLKTAWPQQTWAVVGGPITEQQELTARMFGAAAVFAATPTSHELLNLPSHYREWAITHVLSGRFDCIPAAVPKRIHCPAIWNHSSRN